MTQNNFQQTPRTTRQEKMLATHDPISALHGHVMLASLGGNLEGLEKLLGQEDVDFSHIFKQIDSGSLKIDNFLFQHTLREFVKRGEQAFPMFEMIIGDRSLPVALQVLSELRNVGIDSLKFFEHAVSSSSSSEVAFTACKFISELSGELLAARNINTVLLRDDLEKNDLLMFLRLAQGIKDYRARRELNSGLQHLKLSEDLDLRQFAEDLFNTTMSKSKS